MNAHHETNSGAFDLTRLLFDQQHCANVLPSLDDIWTYGSNNRNETTGFSEKNAFGTVIASGTYTCDSLDRRIGVDETSGGTTTQTWIVYNGDSNTPYAMFNGSGTLLERYLAGPSYVPGVTGMVARTNASDVTDWYLTGKLGSVRDIVNMSGTVIDHISYGAFGSIRAETNPSSGSRFKFDGMRYDTITGLYDDWHRNYKPFSGRFVPQDRMGFLANVSCSCSCDNNDQAKYTCIFGCYAYYSGGHGIEAFDGSPYIGILDYSGSTTVGGRLTIIGQSINLTAAQKEGFKQMLRTNIDMMNKMIANTKEKIQKLDKKLKIDENIKMSNYLKKLQSQQESTLEEMDKTQGSKSNPKYPKYNHMIATIVPGMNENPSSSLNSLEGAPYNSTINITPSTAGVAPVTIDRPTGNMTAGLYTVILTPIDITSTPGIIYYGGSDTVPVKIAAK